jgi:hypothetical protein
VDYCALRFTGANHSKGKGALEGFNISRGKAITMGPIFSLGKKDVVARFSSSNTYRAKVFSANRLNVVLYDIDDRRAWLVDGANALLHLTRTQLSQKEYRDDHPARDEFPYADPSQDHDTALTALLYIGDSDPLLTRETSPAGSVSSDEPKMGLKSLVLDNWEILEQIQDHQIEVSGPGMPVQVSDRDKLEGFGFMDIAAGERNIKPRIATLEHSGRAWSGFTREIEAVTLMARGFGELMKPTGRGNRLCPGWEQVPKSRDYLVARLSHLHDICERLGDANFKPLELVQGLYWHQGDALFEPCDGERCAKSCDRVQVLLPDIETRTKKLAAPFDGPLTGAVIFGQSDNVPRWWPLNPLVAPLDDEAACAAEDSKHRPVRPSKPTFHDSGLGTDSSTRVSDEASSSNQGMFLDRSRRTSSFVDSQILSTSSQESTKDRNETSARLQRNKRNGVDGEQLSIRHHSLKGKEVVRPKWCGDVGEVQPLPEAEDLARHRCAKGADRPSEAAESVKSPTPSIRPSLSSSSQYPRSCGRASNTAAMASKSREDEESGASRRWRRGLNPPRTGKDRSSSHRKEPSV